jgi:hypothetical protein
VDANDNELAYLEAIHFFVEVLDQFFGNVCELDLVFNFYKVSSGKQRARKGNMGRNGADIGGHRFTLSWMKYSWRERSKRRVNRLC